MKPLNKVREHLQKMLVAYENVEYGRMPLEHFEEVFEMRTEYLRNAIDAQRFNDNKKVAEKVT